MTFKFDIKYFITATILSLGSLIIYSVVQSPKQIASAPVSDIYIEIPNFKSVNVEFNPIVLNVLNPDKYLYRKYYKDNGGKPITVFIAFYKNIEKADLSHSPLVCFTGQGWAFVESSEKKITLGTTLKKEITVNQLLQTKADSNLISLFWYQTEHRTFANRGVQKLFLVFDKIFKKSESNAFILLTAHSLNGESEWKVQKSMENFIQELFPMLVGIFKSENI